MSSSIESILAEAHDLIEQDRIDDAQELLIPLKQTARDNPDFWWVYLHAIRDPEEAQDALSRLQELDANYPGIETLTEKAPVGGIQRLGSSSSLLDDFEEDDDWPEDDFEDFEDFDLEDTTTPEKKPSSSGRRSLLLRIGALVAILLVLIIAFILLSGGGDGSGSDDDEPTSVAQGAATSTQNLIPTVGESTDETSPTEEMVTEEATATAVETDVIATEEIMTEEPTATEAEEATATSTEIPTNEPPTETATLEPTSTPIPEDTSTPSPPDLAEVFSTFQLSSESSEMINDGDLGNVFTVNVCTEASTPLRDTLNSAMSLLANSPDIVPADADGVAVALVNCDLDQRINIVGVLKETAQAFATSEITEAEFLAQWRAVGRSG